ncbi:MAG TPA: hypothetical protein VMG63_05685 [Terriglobia bacterium]|nr:hypothetical protein [Terriglobia bacterium]
MKGFCISPALVPAMSLCCTATWRAASGYAVGDYRVLFTLQQNAMRIFGVRHRSEAYR